MLFATLYLLEIFVVNLYANNEPKKCKLNAWPWLLQSKSNKIALMQFTHVQVGLFVVFLNFIFIRTLLFCLIASLGWINAPLLKSSSLSNHITFTCCFLVMSQFYEVLSRVFGNCPLYLSRLSSRCKSDFFTCQDDVSYPTSILVSVSVCIFFFLLNYYFFYLTCSFNLNLSYKFITR